MRQGLIAFIHSNRNGLREMASHFDEKMRSATWERCTRVNRRMIETAPFCTTLLERTLDAQARLEESVPQQHGVDCSLRRLLTEVYEASAGLSGHESPSVRGPPKAPAPPAHALDADSWPERSMSRACLQPHRRRRRVHRPRVTDLPSVEIPPTEDREPPNHVAGPLFIRFKRAGLVHS